MEGEWVGLKVGVVGYSPICQIGSATHSIDFRLTQTLLPSLLLSSSVLAEYGSLKSIQTQKTK
jgi:hypothetical protein